METVGKLLLVGAAGLLVLGLGALLLSRLGVSTVPGTIRWRPSENVRVVVPVGLMIVVSVVGTILLNLFLRR